MTWQQVGWKHIKLARSVAAQREAVLAPAAELAPFRVPHVTTSQAS
jgi:hypothetical protein